MEGTTYSYVRVSTQEQNEACQLATMREFGVAEKNIIVEKLSGKDFNRPRYQRLVRGIGAEDVLVVKSIDRLGRNYEEILNQWGSITKKRKAAIVVLDMPLLDTRRGRDLTGMLMLTLSSSSLTMWPRRNGKISANGKPRALRRQRPGVCGSGRRTRICRIILKICGRPGAVNANMKL